MANISLLGCGAWGSAIAQTLADNGHTISAWHYKSNLVDAMQKDRHHAKLKNLVFNDNISFDSNIESCLLNPKLVVIAVPSHATRELMNISSKYFTSETIIINLS